MSAINCFGLARDPNRFHLPTASRIVAALLISMIAIASTSADEKNPSETPANETPANNTPKDDTAKDDTAKDDTNELQFSSQVQMPSLLPDGRPIRTIGLYQSQMDDLIPDHFLPISVQRLVQGLSRLAPQSIDDQRSRLSGAVYWIDIRDDELISRRSEIDLQSESKSVVRRSLGQVNMAIEQPDSRESTDRSEILPRLENDPNGDLVAVFGGDSNPQSKLKFKWRLRGTAAGVGYLFDIRLPRTPQTRIILSVPPNIELQSLDGVLRSRLGPPPDADIFVSVAQKRWYELDAGGLNRVRIRTLPTTTTTTKNPLIVRNHSVQYHADATGMKWICRMRIQAPGDTRFPPFLLRNTTVTNVRINAFDVPFTSVTQGVQRRVQIEAPVDVLEDQSDLILLTVNGTSALRPDDRWYELPMPFWLGNVTYASTVDRIQLVIPESLQIAKWDLPSDWNLQTPQTIDDGSVMLAASGPPPRRPLSSNPKRTTLTEEKTLAWSRVRLARRPSVDSSETALRLELADGSLTARARIAVKTEPDRLAPFQIRVQPGWSIDSIAFVHSARVIENPRIPVDGRIVSLWPEPEDIDRGQISLELTGNLLMEDGANRLTIPATWFVAPHQTPGDQISAIIRPPDLNWSNTTFVQNEQITPSELPESAARFFGALPPETLLFRPKFGRTPAVSLKTPIAAFDATTRFYVWRDRDELLEHLEIKIESSGQRVQQIAVQTGPSQQRPPFVWSLGDRDVTRLIRLPASAISVGEGTQNGLYVINLTDQSLRGHRLIARRSYNIDVHQTISLPIVPGATTARSDAWIGPGLSLTKKPPEVRTILFDPNQTANDSMISQGRSSGGFDLRGSIGLRYEQSLFPKITISKSDHEKRVAIVRREQVRIVASSRGIDRIEASYVLSPSAKPVRIEFDPSLSLVSVSRNDTAIELDSIQQQQVTIPPRSKTETIRLAWNRDQYENLWIRKCSVPRISISGIVFRSEYELIPASDAFAPAALLHGLTTASDGFSSIELQSGDTVTLIRRNLVLASGWLIAMLVFALSWVVARRTPLVLASACAIVVIVLFLWWPWKVAVIGWLLVPMVAAGMLVTLGGTAGRQAGSVPKNPDQDSNDKQENESADYSVQTVFRLLPWSLLFVNIASSSLVAQEANSDPSELDSSPTKQAVDVLVPVDPDGEQVGSIVYIPESIHQQIIRPTRVTTQSEVRFQSARYRLRIDGTSLDRAKQDQRIIEAEYLIHVVDQRQNTNTIRLPLTASSVRRIELMGKNNRLIRFRPETADSIVAFLPGGSLFRLRATLIPETSQIDRWNRLVLSIPKISASRLSVESGQDIDALRVGGAGGIVVPKSELQHWVESIGPRNQLIIDYRIDTELETQATKLLKRRYLIDAGRRAVVIDCQLDPPTVMTIGDSFQFVVRDDRQPVVTSADWDLAETDLLGTKRRSITVTCSHDAPGPVRLNWTLPIENEIGQLSEPYAITIPEIVAMGSTETSPAWIALQCDPALQFAPLVGDDIEPLSVDHFRAAWTGHRVRYDRAYVVVSGLPSPVIQASPQTKSTVTQEHHLHVTRDRLELQFHATIVPKSNGKDLYTLKFPRQLQLLELVVNGTSRPFRTLDDLDTVEVALGDLPGAESIDIRARSIFRLDKEAQFTPPDLTISPATIRSDMYLVSRDPSIAIHAGDEQRNESVALPNDTAVAWLKQGRSPAMLRKGDRKDQTYRVETFRRDFNSQQLISIDRRGGTWTLESKIHFASDRMPDVIDVEAPSRWCDSLEVEGALQWMQLDVSDSSRQIIRIRYDKQSVAKRSLVIRSRLRDEDTAALSVPSIQVLGPGRRQVYVDIPSRSPTGESFQWQTSAVEASPLPPRWIDSKAAGETERSTFVVANPSWSIELAAVPETDVDPVAFLFDGQVFSQHNGALVHCRWNLFPGSRDSINVHIPDGTTVLAAWTAGRAVDARPVDRDPKNVKPTDRQIEVPLSVSQLPQSVELLCGVSSKSAMQGRYIPELIDVPVTRKWLVHHVPKYQSATPGSAQSALLSRITQNRTFPRLAVERQVSMAASIVDSIESTERVSGQSQQEITARLRLWLFRYQRVHQQSQSTEAPETVRSQWRELDSRLARFFQRRGTTPDDLPPITDADLSPMDPAAVADFDTSDFDGFEIDRITKLSATDQSPTVQPTSSSDRRLKTLIFNGLTIVLVLGALVCLIPVYRRIVPWTAHPAFWLAWMGIFGFAVAPTPVAGAMVLLAIALPVIPGKRRLSSLTS